MIVKELTVDLDTPTGAMRTLIVRPVADARRPGLVLFSEIFQITGPIRRTAVMLAGHGYTVAVPEIFHDLEPPGTVLAYDQQGADTGNHHKTARPIAAYDGDARAAVDHLLGRDDATGAVGAIGFCIGGHLAFRCALDPRVRAAVCFYATDLHKGSLGSGGDDSLARAGEIRGDLTMIWGRQDPHIDDAGRGKILARLREAGVRFAWHEFNGVHAFMRDEGPRYDPALALACTRLALDALPRG